MAWIYVDSFTREAKQNKFEFRSNTHQIFNLTNHCDAVMQYTKPRNNNKANQKATPNSSILRLGNVDAILYPFESTRRTTFDWSSVEVTVFEYFMVFYLTSKALP